MAGMGGKGQAFADPALIDGQGRHRAGGPAGGQTSWGRGLAAQRSEPGGKQNRAAVQGGVMSAPKSDIEIARAAKMVPIAKLAKDRLGIDAEHLEPYGHYKAKVPLSYVKTLENKPDGTLILVTAMTPTTAGEGKTTTSVGLADALNRIGKKTIVALREPSLGPVFGMKGGAAGGGYAQVVPMEDINLHFTGDFHAIGAANHLLAAMVGRDLLDRGKHTDAHLVVALAVVPRAWRNGGDVLAGQPLPAPDRALARAGIDVVLEAVRRSHGGRGRVCPAEVARVDRVELDVGELLREELGLPAPRSSAPRDGRPPPSTDWGARPSAPARAMLEVLESVVAANLDPARGLHPPS